MVRSWMSVVLGLAIVACTDGGPAGPLGDVAGGTYRLTIQTNSGAVIEGTLDLEVADDSTVTGTKTLSLKSGSGTGLEPLFEGGTVEGRVLPDRIWLALNPLYADHNFFLDGNIAADHVTGRFSHVGIVGGVEDLGSFEAR